MVVNIRVPFWGTLNNRCRITIGTQKGTLILTTTQIRTKACSLIQGSGVSGIRKNKPETLNAFWGLE